MPDFYSLTKITKGAYLGRTPLGREFVLVAYYEDGSAELGGKILTGTFWVVMAPKDEAEPYSDPEEFQGYGDWFEALNDDLAPEGWVVKASSFRTRYQARIWAERELDR